MDRPIFDGLHHRIESFWRNRALKLVDCENRSSLQSRMAIANLTSNEVEQKMRNECDSHWWTMTMDLLGEENSREMTVAEPGCGLGRWTKRLSESFQHVHSFDFQEDFISECRKLDLDKDKVTFQTCTGNDFNVSVDVVFSAGWAPYVDEMELARMFSMAGSYIVLFESYTTENAVPPEESSMIVDKFSEQLGSHYAAVYRKISWWNQFLAYSGFKCVGMDVFPAFGTNRSPRMLLIARREKYRKLLLGVFDMFHIGHTNVIRAAGDVSCSSGSSSLTVGICGDEWCTRSKRCPAYNETTREKMVMEQKSVDHTFVFNELDFMEVGKFDLVCHGPDISEVTFNYVKQFCRTLELPRTEGISTTFLLNERPIVGIDYHDTLTLHPSFFKTICMSFKFVYIVTGTPESMKKDVERGLSEFGIDRDHYVEILCGFEYDKQNMTHEHFQRMKQHKLQLLKNQGITVYFDDNPYYAEYLRNYGITVFQTILSDNYLEAYKEKHPHFTGNLQEGQFRFLDGYVHVEQE